MIINEPQPTVFHITHHKAGSQWVREILKHSAPDRFVSQEVLLAQLFEKPIKPGHVYASVYIPKNRFNAVLKPLRHFGLSSHSRLLRHPHVFFQNWLNFQIRRKPYVPFVVIRDLRDTLVSLYFSMKISHQLLNPVLHKSRQILHTLDTEQGLIYLMQEWIHQQATIQLSWLNDDALMVRYEELLSDEHTVFERILDYCRIEVDKQRLHWIIKDNSFESITGRKPGEEDVAAHQRKGIAGDWRTHFTKRIKNEFKKRFGDVLIRTGYESDFNW